MDSGLGEDGLVGSSSPRADRPKRRTFTAEYKLAIVAEYDALTEPGARGALLRREGLYHSHIIEWRRARDAGVLAGPTRCPAVWAPCRDADTGPDCSGQVARTRHGLTQPNTT
jgi:transposase